MTRKSLFDGSGVTAAGGQESGLSAHFLPYARSRQMENGAYSSWRYMDSGLPSVKDTFWALRICKNLSAEAPSANRTRHWLETGLSDIWGGGDMENIFYALFSCRMLHLPWPDIGTWLERSSEFLLSEQTTDREAGGKIRDCLFWLHIERKNAVKLDEVRCRLGKYLESCQKKVLNKQIGLDLPTYGALIEGLSLTNAPVTPSVGRFLERYRDDVTVYRLTPDSRTYSLETLWWGTRLDRQLVNGKPSETGPLGELLESHKTRNGGYGSRPGAIPDLESTGMALDVLLWSEKRIEDGS